MTLVSCGESAPFHKQNWECEEIAKTIKRDHSPTAYGNIKQIYNITEQFSDPDTSIYDNKIYKICNADIITEMGTFNIEFYKEVRDGKFWSGYSFEG